VALEGDLRLIGERLTVIGSEAEAEGVVIGGDGHESEA
jgi:hypothetical protein